jgi:hypothetical protein
VSIPETKAPELGTKAEAAEGKPAAEDAAPEAAEADAAPAAEEKPAAEAESRPARVFNAERAAAVARGVRGGQCAEGVRKIAENAGTTPVYADGENWGEGMRARPDAFIILDVTPEDVIAGRLPNGAIIGYDDSHGGRNIGKGAEKYGHTEQYADGKFIYGGAYTRDGNGNKIRTGYATYAGGSRGADGVRKYLDTVALPIEYATPEQRAAWAQARAEHGARAAIAIGPNGTGSPTAVAGGRGRGSGNALAAWFGGGGGLGAPWGAAAGGPQMDPAQVAQMLKTMIAVVVLALGGRIPDGLDVDTREAQEVMASLGTALGGAPQGKLAPGLS